WLYIAYLFTTKTIQPFNYSHYVYIWITTKVFSQTPVVGNANEDHSKQFFYIKLK
ncbi:MAG: hypothetical protein RIR31_458, partial [Bacteroidota bacterium]